MSLEKQIDELLEIPDHDPKNNTQHTTKYCVTQTSPSVPPFDIQSCYHSGTETSFDSTMHQQNVENIKMAADRLLEECLKGQYNKKEGFKDSTLYKVKAFEVKGDNQLESLIVHNQLLSQEQIKELGGILEKEDGIAGFMLQILQSFGLTVGKELVYVISQLFHKKITEFRNLIDSKESIIPKMNCFQNCGDDFLIQVPTSCPIYEEISLEEVIEFAEKDIEICAQELYFSKIRVLNLKEITCECKRDINLIDKFTRLVRQISKSVFLTIIGATEPQKGMIGLQLSREEMSVAQFSQGGLSIQKSLSRPFVPLEEQQSYDFISKKLKFE